MPALAFLSDVAVNPLRTSKSTHIAPDESGLSFEPCNLHAAGSLASASLAVNHSYFVTCFGSLNPTASHTASRLAGDEPSLRRLSSHFVSIFPSTSLYGASLSGYFSPSTFTVDES